MARPQRKPPQFSQLGKGKEPPPQHMWRDRDGRPDARPSGKVPEGFWKRINTKGRQSADPRKELIRRRVQAKQKSGPPKNITGGPVPYKGQGIVRTSPKGVTPISSVSAAGGGVGGMTIDFSINPGRRGRKRFEEEED